MCTGYQVLLRVEYDRRFKTHVTCQKMVLRLGVLLDKPQVGWERQRLCDAGVFAIG